MTKTALILVDIQNDYFDGGSWPVDQMAAVAGNAARLLAQARAVGDLVLHVRHEASAEAPFFKPGTEGAEIHVSVLPEAGEAVVVKNRPNSFVGTDLQSQLEGAGIKKLVICGAMSQMCIDATARAAADMGYAVTVAADACGAKEAQFGDVSVAAEQVQAAFMSALAMTYGAVKITDDILS